MKYYGSIELMRNGIVSYNGKQPHFTGGGGGAGPLGPLADYVPDLNKSGDCALPIGDFYLKIIILFNNNPV